MPLTIRLPDPLRERARHYQEATGIPLNRLVAVALDNWLSFVERQQGRASQSNRVSESPKAATSVSQAATPEKPRYHDPCRCGSGRKFGKCCMGKS